MKDLKIQNLQVQRLFFQQSSLKAVALPNKACTRRWGFGGIFKPFSTPQHFSNRTAFRRPPQRG
jgi:hypothetical protein